MKSLEDTINEEVAFAVERIVRASRSIALAAFDHQFEQLGRQTQRQQASAASATTTTQRSKSRAAPRRNADDIAKLGARFLVVVRSNPGQPMSVLAPEVGVKSSELQVPIARLKAKKQLKTVGQRHLTCYFPVDGDIAA